MRVIDWNIPLSLFTDKEAIERVVIHAFAAAAPDQPVTRDSEILQLVDSIGVLMVVSAIQTKLEMRLQPLEIIRLFQCHAVGDVIEVLGNTEQA